MSGETGQHRLFAMTSELPTAGATVLLDRAEVSALGRGSVVCREFTGDATIRLVIGVDRQIFCDVYRLFPRPAHLSCMLPKESDGELRLAWHKTALGIFVGDLMIGAVDVMREEPFDRAAFFQPFVRSLGEDWLSSVAASDHPVARLRNDMAARADGDAVRLISLPPMIALRNAFDRASSFEGFEGLRDNLRDPNRWLDTAAEVIAASTLSQQVLSTRFVPPSSNQGVKTPDLRLVTHGGVEVAVEVKRIEHGSAELARETARFPSFLDVCAKVVRRRPFSFFFILRAPLTNELADHATAVLATLDPCGFGPAWTLAAKDQVMELWCCSLPRGATEGVSPEVADPTRMYFRVRAETEDGPILMEGAQANALAFSPSTFESRIQKARQQVPAQGPSIVCVEVPWYGRRSDLDTHFAWLREKTSRGDFSRINRFCLFWLDESAVWRLIDGQSFLNPAGARYEFAHFDHPTPRTPVQLGDF
jgi:hypothetical protein